MALVHAHSGDVINLRPYGANLASAASKALLKTPDWEIMRIVLPAGKTIPQHQVPGDISLLCIEGSVVLEAHGKTEVLRAGDMVYLQGGAAHALHAVEDTSLLHTILFKHGFERQ